MKLLFSLMLIMLLVGCTPQLPTPEPNIPENITERINEEIILPTPTPETEPLNLGTLIISNQTVIEKGIAITLEGIYRNEEEQRLYMIIQGEDRAENEEKRDATQWQAALYFTRQNYQLLFLCDFEQQEKTWEAIYCIEERDIPKNWYEQKMWLVYTLQEPNLFNERTSILELLREEDLYVFKIILPRP
ncbi:MAG: hypothetical protein Q7R56_03615 [Nanoarchaeota archaeon]|nr:hypothetical protein [Nanoarchaeota archaeon]